MVYDRADTDRERGLTELLVLLLGPEFFTDFFTDEL